MPRGRLALSACDLDRAVAFSSTLSFPTTADLRHRGARWAPDGGTCRPVTTVGARPRFSGTKHPGVAVADTRQVVATERRAGDRGRRDRCRGVDGLPCSEGQRTGGRTERDSVGEERGTTWCRQPHGAATRRPVDDAGFEHWPRGLCRPRQLAALQSPGTSGAAGTRQRRS